MRHWQTIAVKVKRNFERVSVCFLFYLGRIEFNFLVVVLESRPHMFPTRETSDSQICGKTKPVKLNVNVMVLPRLNS